MVNLRKVCISDDIFSDYEYLVDIDEMDTIDELINYVLQSLENILQINNFNILVENLRTKKKKKKFHIHGLTFESILLMQKPEDIIYICSHVAGDDD